jgi:signal transduction histidine kinase
LPLTSEVLTELIEETRHAADAGELLERSVRRLSGLGLGAALLVHQAAPPHRVRTFAVQGLPVTVVDALAARAPERPATLRALLGPAPLPAGVPETTVCGSAPLGGGAERVTLACTEGCDPGGLALFTSFLALALDRDLALTEARRSSDLFHQGPLVVYRWRNEVGWPVEYVSPNVSKVFGFPVEDLVEQPYAPHVHPDDLGRVGGEVMDALELGRTYFEQQYRVLDAQGQTRDIYDFTHVVRDERGAVTHFHGYMFDDGERKRAERAKAELMAQLQQSQKLQAVGTLASGIAHDFNNALAAILAHLELARLDSAVGANADVQAAVKSALKGRDIVRQLLVFGRARVEERKPWRLQQIIEDAMGLIRSSIPSTIGLRLGLDARAPMVLADATQLQQVLVNLVTNAAHAMPKGGVVEIAVSTVPGDPPCVSLSVRDSGEGMPPEVLERAFEPFFTTKPIGSGTGLGLSMVHSLVTAHGGTVTLQSEAGKGTTATVTLPGVQPARVAAPAVAAGPPRGRQQRIALVDDEPLVARSTERLVSFFGYRVTTHSDGLSLLKAFEQDPNAYELVLTDQTMPEITGMDLATTLRARGVKVPVLLVTGLPTHIDPTAVAPPFQVLAKPYRSEELALGLAQLLAAAKGPG